MPYTEAVKALEHELKECLDQADLNKSHGWKNEDEIEEAKQIESAISLLKVSSFGGLTALVSLVRQWGKDKGITGPDTKATVQTQFDKLLEEVGEIGDGIKSKDQHAIIDGIGDSTVVLILLAELAGVKFETCLMAAYEEIKGRTGTMIDGKFVKNS